MADKSSSAPVVVAIDGPSGAGRSVVARKLAQALGFHYAPSGALYRAVGWLVTSHAVPLWDDDRIAALLAETPFDITLRPGHSAVWAHGRDISGELGGEAAGRAASAVATLPGVRQIVTARLRRLRCQGSLVMEGRDIGTVVFPDADVKFFLDASPAVRTRRRWREMRQAGHRDTFEEVRQAIDARDEQGRARALAPLVPAADARVIDTADFSIDGLVRTMVSETKHNILRGNG